MKPPKPKHPNFVIKQRLFVSNWEADIVQGPVRPLPKMGGARKGAGRPFKDKVPTTPAAMAAFLARNVPRQGIMATQQEVRDIAVKYCPAIIEEYGKVFLDETQPWAVRQAVGKELLDRGVGRPVQPVNHGDANGELLVFEQLTDDKLELVIARVSAAIEAVAASARETGPHPGRPPAPARPAPAAKKLH